MIQELESIDIIQLLNSDLWSDPNTNYNILENLLSFILNKHIPIRRVKLNKYKHKKTDWITNGILKSIKFRDNLYNRMKQINQDSVEYIHIKINLATYKRILKRTIRNAKVKFYNSKFNKCKADTKQILGQITAV